MVTVPAWAVTKNLENPWRKRSKIVDAVACGDQDDDGDVEHRQVLLVGKVSIAGQENVELDSCQSQQFAILLAGPPHLELSSRHARRALASADDKVRLSQHSQTGTGDSSGDNASDLSCPPSSRSAGRLIEDAFVKALASLDPRNADFGLDESLDRARGLLLRDG